MMNIVLLNIGQDVTALLASMIDSINKVRAESPVLKVILWPLSYGLLILKVLCKTTTAGTTRFIYEEIPAIIYHTGNRLGFATANSIYCFNKMGLLIFFVDMYCFCWFFVFIWEKYWFLYGYLIVKVCTIITPFLSLTPAQRMPLWLVNIPLGIFETVGGVFFIIVWGYGIDFLHGHFYNHWKKHYRYRHITSNRELGTELSCYIYIVAKFMILFDYICTRPIEVKVERLKNPHVPTRGEFPLDFDVLSAMVEQDSVANLRYGVLFLLALSSLGVYSIILAGWSSNSKYAFIGALRSAAQMISYEVAISLIILPIVVMAGSLNLTMITHVQNVTTWFLWPLLPVSILFLIAMLAETNRTPFDLPEAEAELVAGYNVDYSSLPFAMFFLGEYCNMILISTVYCLLFLSGGLNDLGVPSEVILAMKAAAIWIFFVVVRATLPRYRYDQLMDIGWKVFLPFSGAYLIFIFGLLVYFDALPVANELPLASSVFSSSFLFVRLSSLSVTRGACEARISQKFAQPLRPSDSRSCFNVRKMFVSHCSKNFLSFVNKTQNMILISHPNTKKFDFSTPRAFSCNAYLVFLPSSRDSYPGIVPFSIAVLLISASTFALLWRYRYCTFCWPFRSVIYGFSACSTAICFFLCLYFCFKTGNTDNLGAFLMLVFFMVGIFAIAVCIWLLEAGAFFDSEAKPPSRFSEFFWLLFGPVWNRFCSAVQHLARAVTFRRLGLGLALYLVLHGMLLLLGIDAVRAPESGYFWEFYLIYILLIPSLWGAVADSKVYQQLAGSFGQWVYRILFALLVAISAIKVVDLLELFTVYCSIEPLTGTTLNDLLLQNQFCTLRYRWEPEIKLDSAKTALERLADAHVELTSDQSLRVKERLLHSRCWEEVVKIWDKTGVDAANLKAAEFVNQLVAEVSAKPSAFRGISQRIFNALHEIWDLARERRAVPEKRTITWPEKQSPMQGRTWGSRRKADAAWRARMNRLFRGEVHPLYWLRGFFNRHGLEYYEFVDMPTFEELHQQPPIDFREWPQVLRKPVKGSVYRF
jgi:formate hydrogenlyase subunit 4